MSRKESIGDDGEGRKAAESRKLVKWGSSETLIMSLPRSWVKKFQLNKDSEVSIVENQDGSLLVAPLQFGSEKPRFESTILLSSDDFEDMDLVELEITVKYLDGNDVITIEKKEGKGVDKFPTKFTLKVQEVVQSLLGLEITSLLSTKIKIQDIMNIHETNVDVLVKIIADTTVDLFQNVIDIMREGDYAARADSLLISKRQVRKYFLRIMRELRKGLLVPASLARMGLTAQDTVDAAFYIDDISGVADELEFAFNAMANKKKDPDKKVVDIVVAFMNDVYELFKKGVDSFLFKSRKDAIHVIKTAPSIEESKRKIENMIDDLSATATYPGYQILLDIMSKILDHTFSIALASCRRIM
ncbi:MAG: AbrB/MazE/SpoVT family DNA-binding domain-containing protein [Candidatus Lokiarchaeota archaeon]|nr:AbrB/MazE/SpoVT family DNA-binding domain-containing protein [Candidatus Lokiarchaeota archaeon]